MKITFVKNYSSNHWIKSSENLLPSTKSLIYMTVKHQHPNCSEIFIMNLVRNSMGSVNSYEIIDIDRDDENQIIKATFSILSLKDWDHTINSALIIFNEEIQKKPQIILMNDYTINEIEKFLPHEKNIFGVFESKNGNVQVCIDNTLCDFDFCLVNDEQAKIESA